MIRDWLSLNKLAWAQVLNRAKVSFGKSPLLMIGLVLAGCAFFYGYLRLATLLMEFVFRQDVYGVILATKLLQILLFIGLGVALMSSLNTAISNLFLSKDLEFQFSLPVSFSAWMMHRYQQVFIQSSWMLILFAAPFFWIFLGLSETGVMVQIIGVFAFIMVCSFPVTAAILACIFLVKVFPAKRIHQVFLVMTLVLSCVLVFLFRYLEPEQFIGPGGIDRFRGYMDLVALDRQQWNPAIWAANFVTALGQKEWAGSLPHAGRLVGAFIFSICLFLWVSHKVYRTSLDRALQSLSGEGQLHAGRYRESRLSLALHHPRLNQASRELLLFLRDPSQWSQIFVMVALLGLYLFSLTKIPMEPFGSSRLYLALGNTGFVAFIALSLASRFSFTTFSSDGEAIWLMKTIPGGWGRFVESKFWVFGIPIIIFAMGLSVLSGLVIDLDSRQLLMLAAYSFWDSLFMVGMSMALGMLFIQPNIENPLKLVVSPGGFLLMAIGLFTTLVHVLLRMVENSEFLAYVLIEKGWPDFSGQRALFYDAGLMLAEAIAVRQLLLKGIKHLKRGQY